LAKFGGKMKHPNKDKEGANPFEKDVIKVPWAKTSM
jgi:hypothetical protein